MTDRFERELARLHGSRFGLMCNSGTSALQIALAAIKEREGWRDGDEVLVPAVTFIATSNVVLFNNLKPVFVDVEPDFYCIDPAQIERYITPRTRAIMPVHVGGLPCDMGAIMEIARRRGLHVVEDSAECMFATHRGQHVGSFGTIGCFSTYVAHIITTGVGGVCVTNDPEYHGMLRSLMNHGRDSIYVRIDDDQGLQGKALQEVVSRRFSFVRLGFSYRATEMEAALGVAQLEEREQSKARRMQVAASFTEGLAGYSEHLRLPVMRPETSHAWMFYPLTVLRPGMRERLVQHLEERQVETRYLLPLINQPVYRRMFGNLDAQYPVAAGLNANAFYVGCHEEMSDADVAYVIDGFASFFEKGENR